MVVVMMHVDVHMMVSMTENLALIMILMVFDSVEKELIVIQVKIVGDHLRELLGFWSGAHVLLV